MPLVSISNAQRAPVLWANWRSTVYHGLPTRLYAAGSGVGGYRLYWPNLSGEATGLGNRDRPACWATAGDRGKGQQSRSLLQWTALNTAVVHLQQASGSREPTSGRATAMLPNHGDVALYQAYWV
jgi:hypothetical protein